MTSFEPFDPAQYLSKKKREKRLAWIFTILGSVVLLDSGLPFPIPLMGAPSIFFGGALLGFGYYQFTLYKKFPLHETLQLAHSLDRPFTRTDLFLTFQLSPKATDALIAELIQHGFVEVTDTDLPPESDMQYRVIR